MYFSNDTKLYIVLYHVVSYTLYIYIYDPFTTIRTNSNVDLRSIL